jgi:mannosyltransferase
VTVEPRASVGPGSGPPPAQERSATRTGLLTRATPVLLLAVTAVVCAYQLGAKSLWHDEAFTLAVARSDGDTFRRSLGGEESFAALYYSVIRLSPPLWENEWTLRAPSVVFAVLAALGCYAVGRRLFGLRVAVIATLLLSTNLLFVQYAQEARGYALALWLVTLATWALVRAVQRPTWPMWLAFGAVSAAAAYAHFFAALVLAGQLLSLLPYRSMVPWRKVAGAAGLAGVLLLPLAAVLLPANAGGRPLLAQTRISGLAGELAGISPAPLGVFQAVLYGLCAVAAVLAFVRQRGKEADPVLGWRYSLLACWLVTPVALAGLISLVWPVFVTRYFVVCLPAVALLLAVGMTVARPAVQVAVLLVVLLAAAQGLHQYYLQSYKDGENWRGLVEYVAQEARPGDTVIFLSRFGRRPFEYYLARHAGLAPSLRPIYPSLPWGGYPPVTGEPLVDAAGDQARFRAAEPERVWVVLLWGGFRTADDDGAPFSRILAGSYVQADQRFFGKYLKLALFEHT